MISVAENMTKILKFSGITAGVQLDVDQPFLLAVPFVFGDWPYALLDDWSGDILASISFNENKYTVSSDFMDKPLRFSDPVNALCCLIVELAWAHLRDAPDLLCLHGAAVEFGGRLVVFPSTRRAGKSTLSLALAAAGHRLFTDDFMPLSVEKSGLIQGMAHGISPRVRLPLPKQIGPRAFDYFQARPGASNAQYRYVKPIQSKSVSFGSAAPIGALVFLEHGSDNGENLQEIGCAEALKSLITQNFSRAMIADSILETLSAIVDSVPAYRLEYDELEPAIDLLQANFNEWKTEPATLNATKRRDAVPAPDTTTSTKILDWRIAILGHADGIMDVNYGGDRFLAVRKGREIQHLNSGAAAIWQLLSDPTSLAEVVEMMAAVYPEQPVAALAADIETTIETFIQNGLVQSHPVVCHDGTSLKECQHAR